MEIGLFIIRLVVGGLLMAHGTQKLFGWFGGYGVAGTGGFMESLHMRPGRLMALAAGTAEALGGLLLALGLFTPLAALLIASVMFVAARTAHRGKGVFAQNGGFELPLVNAAVAIGLALDGAGKWSLDNAIGWDVSGVAWGLGALALAVIGGLGAIEFGRRHGRRPVRGDVHGRPTPA
jgi:putative oxidoreductase